MRQRVKNALTSDLVKVTSKTGIATIVKIAASFVVSKVLAIFIGPAGLALMGQLNNLGTMIQALSTGGITLGITKYISEYADDKDAQVRVINTSLKITLICSAVCTLGVVLGHKYLGQYFFGTNKYNTVLLILGATLMLYSFNSLIIAVINGFKNFKLYVIINIATSIIGLLLTVVLVYRFGVFGALISFVLTPAVVFFIAWYYIRKQGWFNLDFLKIKADASTLKLLGRFSLMALNNALVGSLAQITIRMIITGKMDINVAGIWDGMNRLSSAYLILITTSIQVYYLPTLSYIKDKKLLWKEIVKTEKIILPLTIGMFILIFLFRGLIVDILFTKEFALMKSIFIYQLMGDTIKIAAWIISYTMYAKAMSKQIILTDNIFTVLYISISYLIIHNTPYGLDSIYIAYIINNSIYLIFMYVFMKSYISNSKNKIKIDK